MKHRSRSDILAKMLMLAQGSSKKTHLMYNANLSFPQLQEYLQVLESKGLLIHVDDLYHTTKKGQGFLRAYKTMNDMLILEGQA